MVQTDRGGSVWQSVQPNLERRTETSATALCFNSAIVEIDETFGNCESETQSAELSAYRRISLLKWLKQRSQPLRLNSNPCVGNFEMKASISVVKRAERDLSALRGEFHGVVDQVPEHLLKPDAVSQDVILFRLQLSRDLQLLCCDRRMCRLERVFDDFVRVASYQFEMKLSAINPGKVEQVVNQSGLQLHIALNNLNVLDELWRKFLRVILEVGGCCQCRRQRRAQLMAERCQKIVLRFACFLRCNFFRFKLPAPYLVSDVACDFGETANFPGLIMKR